MIDPRPALVLGALAVGLVVASTLAPRSPPLAHLAAHANPSSATRFPEVRAARCSALYSAEAPFVQSPTGADARFRYQVCAPSTWLDDWRVEVRAAGGAGWRVTGVTSECGAVERCAFDLGPWESAAVVALDAAGRPLGDALLILGFSRSSLNLRAADLARIGLVALMGLALVLATRSSTAWRGRRAELTLIGCGIAAGALAALRPVVWGGAASALAAAVAVLAAVTITVGTRLAIGRMRGPVVTGALVIVVIAIATTLESLLVLERWPHARELQRIVIAAATTWTVLMAAAERGATRAWVIGTAFGLGAVALEAITRPPMPYPGVFGAYLPWELVTAGWPVAAMGRGLARARTLAARPASWTARVAEPLSRLARGEDVITSRARLEAELARRPTWPSPNRATAGFVFAIARALGRRLTTTPRAEPARATGSIVLFDPKRAQVVRGEIEATNEPRAALFEGERALEVHDGDRRAAPALVADVAALLDGIDARVGVPGGALERTTVRLGHPGDAITGRSFELALGLLWFGVRAARTARLPRVLATGRIASDRDSVLPVQHLAAKLAATSPGEVMLVPGAQADEARSVPGVVVIDAAPLGPARARRRANRLAREGARVAVLVTTLGVAVRLVFGGQGA